MKQIISKKFGVSFLKTVFIFATAALPVSLARAEAVFPVVYGDTNESFCSISGELGADAQYFQNYGSIRRIKAIFPETKGHAVT